MRGLEEIYKMNGQDVSFMNRGGRFEKRPYGKIFIPACFCTEDCNVNNHDDKIDKKNKSAPKFMKRV